MTTTTERRVGVAHGLTLHVRDWLPNAAAGRPVLCLAGFSRSLEDFSELAAFLTSAEGGRRRVVALSARGRGESDRDPEPARYDARVEAVDALSVADALSLPEAHVIGTSRGGLQAMTAAALRPTFLKGVVLNDIGPVIEPQGLIRIRGYLSSAAAPADWPEAFAAIARVHEKRFPALAPADFERMARRTWREGPDGRLEPAHDPKIMEGFSRVDLEKPLPPLWPLFDALANSPVMVIRGENSDILSAETVPDMARRRPDLRVHVVPGQGHAPLLADRPTQEAIAAFLEAAEG